MTIPSASASPGSVRAGKASRASGAAATSRIRRGSRVRRAAGQEGQQGDQGQLGQLGERQGNLKKRLEELMRDMEGQGFEGDSALGDAGKEMGSAEGQLGEGDANRAFGSQGRALEALRQGAQGMADKMQQGQGQAQQGPGQPGRRQGGRQASQDDTDPLGRPTRSRRYDPGSTVRVPGEIEAQRARRVLEELRRRVGEPTRPQDEIDYLERLLQELSSVFSHSRRGEIKPPAATPARRRPRRGCRRD